jgi:hypothetical protein
MRRLSDILVSTKRKIRDGASGFVAYLEVALVGTQAFEAANCRRDVK